MVSCRKRNVRRGDADNRPVKIPEGLVRDYRGDFRAPSAKPRVFFYSEQAARLGDRTENGLSVERHKRAHVNHLCIDAMLALQYLRSGKHARHHQRECDNRAVAAWPKDLCGSKPVDDLTVRHLALDRVERLVFVKNHRIGIAHRRCHQPDDVHRRRRRDDFHAWDHHRPVLDRLRMLRAETNAAAVAGADHKWAGELTVRHVPKLRHFIRHVVEAHGEEVREHDLRDRPQSRHGRANCGAEDRLFGDRRVPYAPLSELLIKTNCRLEYAAGLADVLAKEDHAFVALHLLRDAAGDGVAIGVFRHAQPPSAYTSAVSNSTGACGDALHASVATSTFRLLSASTASIVSCLTPNSLRRSR